MCAQFIFISFSLSFFFSRVRITSSGDNYRERRLVNRIASRAQYFLACRGRFKPFRSATNICLRVFASPAATPRFFAYAYCDRPDSFLRRPFFPLPHPLSSFFFSFIRPLFYLAARQLGQPVFGRARESAVGRRTFITLGMCIRSHSGMRVSLLWWM